MSPSTHPRFGAIVAYDGTDFAGFQRQNPPFRTVQAEIEGALAKIAGAAVSLQAAGRTDAGVHATGQVIAFALPWRHDAQTLQKALNVNLPRDIAVQALVEVDAHFHPRFDARRRAYTYVVEQVKEGQRNPISHRYRWQLARKLDVQVMNEAARGLLGQHDFATFGTPPQGENTVRELFVAQWVENWEGAATQLAFQIEANAFLFRMVRTIVGSLVQVGLGRWDVERFQTAFAAADRAAAATPAPPNGLFLTKVIYDLGSESNETLAETIR